MASKVSEIRAWKSFDSAGYPTVSASLKTDNGIIVKTSIPNSLHRGKYTAHILHDDSSKYGGKGVGRAVKYIQDLIAPKLINVSVDKYASVDAWLLKADPTENKDVLGANTTFPISVLFYKAAAKSQGIPLYRLLNKVYTNEFIKTQFSRVPSPIFNMISGGGHGAETLNFQEFSIVPSTGQTYAQAMDMAFDLYHDLKRVFGYRNIFSGSGSDGAYIPSLASNIDAFEIIKEGILKRGIKIGMEVYFAIDFAADFFFKGKYYLSGSQGPLNTDQYMHRIDKILKEYKSLILEDISASQDEDGWRKAIEQFGDKSYIVGDDLVQTNIKRLEKAVHNKLINAVTIKPMQRGTVREAFLFASKAVHLGVKTIVSHMPLETNDDFIADFAVGIQADFVKMGAITRGERVSKHNRFLQIEKELRHA